MPLFRFHRGQLQDSLKTTVIVKNINELRDVILFSLENWPSQNKNFTIHIEPYPEDYNFDKRIGWYTHIVTANVYENDKMHPVGFLSEPLAEPPK